MVLSTINLAGFLLTESAISFLGLGPAPPDFTWGGMIGDGRSAIADAWWVSVVPGIAIIGDGHDIGIHGRCDQGCIRSQVRNEALVSSASSERSVRPNPRNDNSVNFGIRKERTDHVTVSKSGVKCKFNRRQALKMTAAAGALLELSQHGASAAPTSTGQQIYTPSQDSGGQLIVGHHVDPTTLDLLDSTTAAYQSVSAAIVEQWIVFDTENLTPAPWLAESYSWIDDLTLEIKIKPGISFTNGEPLDAQSAKLSIDTLMASDSYSFFLKDGVYKETEIVDDLTARVILTEPMLRSCQY